MPKSNPLPRPQDRSAGQGQPRPSPGVSAPWSAVHALVRSQRTFNGQGHVCSARLQHAPWSFVREIDQAALDKQLFRAANEHVKQMLALAGTSASVANALSKDDKADFGWLPIGWGRPAHPGGTADPRGSFMLTRPSQGASRSSR